MSLILIVDDDESIRTSLTEHLEEQAHEVITAENGQDGLQSAKNFAPDAIVVDGFMPIMDGLEFLDKIRQAKETYQVPVVMMTDSQTPREKQRAQQFGVIDYLQKPVSKEDIQLRVKWALKAGTMIPATGWDQADSEAARAGKSLEVDGAESPPDQQESQQQRQRARYKADDIEAVQEVTPELGGTVASPTGGSSVEIPPDSVPDTVGVMIKESDGAAKPANGTLRLRVGDDSPSTDVRVADQTGALIAGLQLNSPARIGIKVNPKQVSQGGKKRVLRVQEYDPETDTWSEVATYVDEKAGVAYTRRDRLGSAPPRRKGRVLIVETDETEFRKVASALDGAGFVVGRETIPSKVKARIAKDRPLIVILGMGVAGPTGSRLLREIKFDPVVRKVTVIPIGHPDDGDVYADAINAGAREVIAGPVKMGELQFRVNRAFEAIVARSRRATRQRAATATPGAAPSSAGTPVESAEPAAQGQPGHQSVRRKVVRRVARRPAAVHKAS